MDKEKPALTSSYELPKSKAKLSVGLLGVKVPETGYMSDGYLTALRLEEVEKRILAIEVFLNI